MEMNSSPNGMKMDKALQADFLEHIHSPEDESDIPFIFSLSREGKYSWNSIVLQL